MTALERLLEAYRKDTASERDKGTAFEKLVAAWLVTDPVQAQRFEKVSMWSDWAREQGQDRSDVGIDLVGRLRGGGHAAIQCKLYAPDRAIHKRDIDSFLAASGKRGFDERVIVETTDGTWSEKAEEMLRDQKVPVTRIGLQQLRESSVDWSVFTGTGKIAAPKPKTLRDDQQVALEKVRQHMASAERGKLIMACGTGKTLLGLRVAEELAQNSRGGGFRSGPTAGAIIGTDGAVGSRMVCRCNQTHDRLCGLFRHPSR